MIDGIGEPAGAATVIGLLSEGSASLFICPARPAGAGMPADCTTEGPNR